MPYWDRHLLGGGKQITGNLTVPVTTHTEAERERKDDRR